MHLLPCAWKQLLGISCPFCGFQRAVLLLCKGEVLSSVLMFPPLFPLAVGVLVSPCLYAARCYTLLKVLWWILLLLLLGNAVYQNICH